MTLTEKPSLQFQKEVWLHINDRYYHQKDTKLIAKVKKYYPNSFWNIMRMLKDGTSDWGMLIKFIDKLGIKGNIKFEL